MKWWLTIADVGTSILQAVGASCKNSCQNRNIHSSSFILIWGSPVDLLNKYEQFYVEKTCPEHNTVPNRLESSIRPLGHRTAAPCEPSASCEQPRRDPKGRGGKLSRVGFWIYNFKITYNIFKINMLYNILHMSVCVVRICRSSLENVSLRQYHRK